MATILFISYLIFTLFTLSRSIKLAIWEAGTVIYLIIATFMVGMPWFPALFLWIVLAGVEALLRVKPLRGWVSALLYQRAIRAIPKLSSTEEEALNAGDAWLEEDLFVGEPDWERVSNVNTTLSEEERNFLDNEVEALCSLLDEWDISQKQDLPLDAWNYIKEKGFLGLVIPKEYGGRGFSARAHSDIITKLASRSGAAAVTVMVPNSLGPGELLQHYGTEEQKSHYLPKLANGSEIPCFALTEPEAGSDATAVHSEAIVIKHKVNDKEELALQLSLNKRWITLAPIATLIGVAVSLKDPEGLLEGKGAEGITCLLLPRDTKNLDIGARHYPAAQAFMNGTIHGNNIIVPITSIIGGQEQAGAGWKMLVECLAIGRSISLPALAMASSSVSYLTASAYSRIRRQFNVEIAQFEGVEEKLAEVAGLNYLINATRLLTVAAVNEYKKPSVASAITKYFNTELSRVVVNAAMDIHGGRTVVLGPRNYLMNYYQSLPISITVEGANIMSRNLLIFGQGSMVCHPFVRKELYATLKKDKAEFTRLLWQHMHYFAKNTAKAILSAWTAGLFEAVPQGKLAKQRKYLTRLSHAYAWLADLSLIVLGGALKRKERVSARLADGLSYLYMAMAVLRQAEQHDEHIDQCAHAEWALAYCFHNAQKAMIELCNNFPSKGLGFIARIVAFPFGATMRYPSDTQSKLIVKSMIQNNQYRDQLKQFIYLSGDSNQPIDRVENALQLLIEHSNVYAKIKDIRRYNASTLPGKLTEKVQKGELSQAEMDTIIMVENARWDAIQVDEFVTEAYQPEKSMVGSVARSNTAHVE